MSALLRAARRFAPARMLLARPRLVGAAVVGLLALQALPWLMPLQDITRYIVAWNVGVLLYLALVGWMMFSEGRQQIRHWAKLEDEGQALVMTLVILAALASLAAIVMELAVVKDLHGWRRAGHILLAILTIFSSWAFIHVMFALHYARSYYASHARGLPPGLEFPARKEPDYGDFLYFACIIGTSGQTADVSYTTSALRKVGTLHVRTVLFFNATVLALMINIAAGLI